MSGSRYQAQFVSLSGAVDPGELVVHQVEGESSLSALFRYEIFVWTERPGGLSPEDIEEMLRAPCTLALSYGSAPPALFHGVLTEVELLPTHTPGSTPYRLRMMPALSRLSLSRSSRVFQDKSWPEIARQVIAEHGLAVSLELSASYPVREYTVQYQESDLDFVSRLLEHWGIFYSFEHGDSGARVILADGNGSFRGHLVPTLRFVPGADTLIDEEVILSVQRTHRVQPATVNVKDYNWRTPRVHPEAEVPADTHSGYGTQRFYADHVRDAGEAAHIATVRAQAFNAEREVLLFTTNSPTLGPGARFELNGYLVGDLDRAYAVTKVEERYSSEGGGPAHYEKTLTAIPLAVPFRPERRTEKPKILGFMHATVDGTTRSPAAPIDEQGRYKVVMPYDVAGEGGGRATRWIRAAQPFSGLAYGHHFPMHIGCEVAIVHLDGDPDRPVIVGAVPNPDTTSPVTEPEATKSRVKTRAGIEIEFEDLAT